MKNRNNFVLSISQMKIAQSICAIASTDSCNARACSSLRNEKRVDSVDSNPLENCFDFLKT